MMGCIKNPLLNGIRYIYLHLFVYLIGFLIHVLLCNCDCTLLLVICTEYFKQFEVLTRVIVKIAVSEDVMLYSLVARYHCFSRSLCPHVQGQRAALPTRREVAGFSETRIPIHKTIPIASQKLVMSELYV